MKKQNEAGKCFSCWQSRFDGGINFPKIKVQRRWGGGGTPAEVFQQSKLYSWSKGSLFTKTQVQAMEEELPDFHSKTCGDCAFSPLAGA